jgi:hypothetical protein
MHKKYVALSIKRVKENNKHIYEVVIYACRWESESTARKGFDNFSFSSLAISKDCEKFIISEETWDIFLSHFDFILYTNSLTNMHLETLSKRVNENERDKGASFDRDADSQTINYIEYAACGRKKVEYQHPWLWFISEILNTYMQLRPT